MNQEENARSPAPTRPAPLPLAGEDRPGEDLVAVAEAQTLEQLRARVRSGYVLKPREVKLLRELEAKERGEDKAATLEALAARLGVRKRTLIRWSKQGMPGQDAAGLYDVAVVRAWRAKGFTLTDQGEGDAEDDEPGLGYWRLMRERETALLAEMKRKREAGELIEAAEVDRREARLLAIVKAALLAFPRALPPLLEGKNRQEAEALIDEEVRSVLERLKTAPTRREEARK